MKYIKILIVVTFITISHQAMAFEFLGFKLGSKENAVSESIGSQNIYYLKPFATEKDTEKAKISGKWIVMERSNAVLWERLGNWLYSDALVTNLVFKDSKLKEIAIYWQFNEKKNADTLYSIMLRLLEDEYGVFFQGTADSKGRPKKWHSKEVAKDARLHLIYRQISANLFQVKTSAILSQQAIVKRTEGNRHYEVDGGFSYIPPKGWIVQKADFSPYEVVYGERVAGFWTTINFIIENSSLSLEKYTQRSLSQLSSMFTNFAIEKEGIFKTSQGLRGKKIALNVNNSDVNMRMVQYFFSNGNKKLNVTCGTHAKAKKKFDKYFDNTVNSLILDR